MTQTKPRAKKRIHDYHFSVGNSTRGPIGFCAVVKATSQREAVRILRARLVALNNEVNVVKLGEDGQIDYLEVYFNETKVGQADINQIDEVDYR